MKEFVEVTREANLYLIELSHKDTSGRTCRKEHRNMWRGATNAKSLCQISINQEESLIPWLALGFTPSGAWILWGLDIVRPLPKAAGNKRYLLLNMDYFTKWVKVKPLVNIRDVDVKKFLWKNIVTSFGVPRTLISGNGLQFDSKALRRYCYDLHITNRYSTPTYPQGNGQAEAVNKVIVSGLKKSLDDANGKWVKELSHVLWAYRTTPRKSISEMPFFMTYEVKTIIPLEIGFPTLRSNSFIPSKNNELLKKSLDLIEDRRESVIV